MGEPCWDCVKGRHLICAGVGSYTGQVCVCPVPHDGNRRKPAREGDRYFDAGDDALLGDE